MEEEGRNRWKAQKKKYGRGRPEEVGGEFTGEEGWGWGRGRADEGFWKGRGEYLSFGFWGKLGGICENCWRENLYMLLKSMKRELQLKKIKKALHAV